MAYKGGNKMNNQERLSIIKELQSLAEEVLNLKSSHRQKRPIVIEFSGSPKAGKTSCINSLELFLKRNGFTVQIVQERASVCPVSDKQSPMFNLWTSCMSLAGLIGVLENNKNKCDVLILDRGIFDALCWFDLLVNDSKMEEEQRIISENFLLMEDLVKKIDIVFAFCVAPEISIEREYANLLTDKPGTIMNKNVLDAYLNSIKNTINNKTQYFHTVFQIDTSNKNQDEVGKEVTSITLDTLKKVLMERIGYIKLDDIDRDSLYQNHILEHFKLSDNINKIEFGLREDVENCNEYIQPIPVAIITNKDKSKILTIRKNARAVSKDSPEKDRLLVYIGGHTRDEDATESIAGDFLSICRNTLKREIKEEIGISVALNGIIPFYIYTPNNDISKKHLAVCFCISLDEDNIKLRLDPQELVLNKGKSKSGRFHTLKQLQTMDCEFEEWSKEILEYCFNTEVESLNQISLLD